MEERQRHEEAVRPHRLVPRWPAYVALLIVGALYAVLSGTLTFGPRAFLLALVSVLLVPLLSAHQTGRRRERHVSEDFLFPQMNFDDMTTRAWSPGFVDYLFLAFNTSTAFSPTDTAILSRRAKALMMVQAWLSLVILAVLVSRAVNTLAAT